MGILLASGTGEVGQGCPTSPQVEGRLRAAGRSFASSGRLRHWDSLRRFADFAGLVEFPGFRKRELDFGFGEEAATIAVVFISFAGDVNDLLFFGVRG